MGGWKAGIDLTRGKEGSFMKHIYAFEKMADYKEYQAIMQFFHERLQQYQEMLEQEYALHDLPKGVVWTSHELATSTFSTVPIPAFTNKDLIYMSPDLASWRALFVRQLEGKDLPHIQHFYEHYSVEHLFIVLAHELAHHSDLFVDDFDDERNDGIWFEEGVCFYLPRKMLLNEADLDEITRIEQQLVEDFKEEHGGHSLKSFGLITYQGSLASIMFDYWRSYLAVKYLVEDRANHDIKQIFDAYHNWHEAGRKQPLATYFGVEGLFDK